MKLTFSKIKQTQFSSQLGLSWYVCWHVDWEIHFPKGRKRDSSAYYFSSYLNYEEFEKERNWQRLNWLVHLCLAVLQGAVNQMADEQELQAGALIKGSWDTCAAGNLWERRCSQVVQDWDSGINMGQILDLLLLSPFILGKPLNIFFLLCKMVMIPLLRWCEVLYRRLWEQCLPPGKHPRILIRSTQAKMECDLVERGQSEALEACWACITVLDALVTHNDRY